MTPSGERSKNWRIAHAEEVAAYQANYYAENKEQLKKKEQEYRKKNAARIKETMARGHLRRKYNMSLEDYDALLAAQGGVCALCRSPSPGRKGAFLVDHDHSSNTVRGLLCHSCNVGLGHFKDNPTVLMTAAEYLRKSNGARGS